MAARPGSSRPGSPSSRSLRPGSSSPGAARSAHDPSVVSLERDHLEEVLSIERAVYPRPWSAEAFADELGRHDRCYLVALEDGEVAGYAGLSVGAGEAHLLTVAVAPARQRRGHGSRLVAALLAEAVAQRIDAVTLEVRESDTSAQWLYRRAGFVAAGVRPGYYQDDGEGALIMWWRRATHERGR
jgi:[ribosomal protein S18]-alanine N-acetyltransferase